MRPATRRLPKALIAVRGKPFADYQLRLLAKCGVRRVVYAIGHLGGLIRDYVGDGGAWGLDVSYSDEGEDALGTAGAVRLAIDRGLMDETFITLYGDSFLPVEISPIWQAAMNGRIPMMTVFRNDNQGEDSNLNFENGLITLYQKGARGMSYIDYGLGILPRKMVAERVRPGVFADLADFYNQLSRLGSLHGYEVFDRYYEVGSPGGLDDFETYLSQSDALANIRFL